jgi:CheY-like chemotaxis protein
METKTSSFIRVYCPELMAMINPGEWTDCPFYRGQKLDVSNTEEALKQIFRCHVQCDCKIHYRYFDKGKMVEKVADLIENPEALRRIFSLVMKQAKKPGQERKKKILIVDDDVDFLEMHSAVLTNKGYSVITAQNSKECLEKLEKTRPDVVVLDVMMEQFDAGFEASKKIKEKCPDLPVMLLTSIGAQTGLEFSSSAETLKATGADVLLDKPVSPHVFIDEIEKLMARRQRD